MPVLKEFHEAVQAFGMVFREFFRAMRDPQAHSERAQAEAQAYHNHRLQVSQELGITPRPSLEIRRFQTLAEALDFVATCLETDAVAGLAEEMDALGGLLEMDPSWPYYFRQYFSALKEIHLTKDLRQLYAGESFPDDAEWLELGGTFGDLEHKAIRFAKKDRGWVLDSILMYR